MVQLVSSREPVSTCFEHHVRMRQECLSLYAFTCQRWSLDVSNPSSPSSWFWEGVEPNKARTSQWDQLHQRVRSVGELQEWAIPLDPPSDSWELIPSAWLAERAISIWLENKLHMARWSQWIWWHRSLDCVLVHYQGFWGYRRVDGLA